jgi:transcriptional regulator with XRE-family HTH domain
MQLDRETEAYEAALAAELRRLRNEAGLSQTRLASDAGLTQPMIAFVEKEIKTPTVSSLYRLARVLGTTPGAILTAVDASLVKAAKRPRTKKKEA